MYVCVCHAVTETTVRAAIRDGAGDVDAVGRACNAGTDCGSCHNEICELIWEAEPVPRRGRRLHVVCAE